MSNDDLPDRIKATLTIDLDFAKEDQPLITEVLQQIIDNLWLSETGNGSRTPQSHYSYKVESNIPKKPMTMDRLLKLMDSATEPGEATATERVAESMREDYDQAVDWWEGLSDAQRGWMLEKHPGLNLVTKAWDAHEILTDADRALFQGLK